MTDLSAAARRRGILAIAALVLLAAFLTPVVPMRWLSGLSLNTNPPKPLPAGTRVKALTFQASVPKGSTGTIELSWGKPPCHLAYGVRYDDWAPDRVMCQYEWVIEAVE